VIHCHGPGQSDDRGLRGRVDGEPAGSQCGDRGNVDDRAAFGRLDHGRDGEFREQEHTLDIDLHHAPVLFGPFINDTAAAADTNIVVEEVEAAPAVDGGIDQRFAIGFVGDVASMRRRHAACRRDHLDGAFGRFEITIGHQHFGACARQQHGRRPTVADAIIRRSPSADERDLVHQARIFLKPLHRFASLFASYDSNALARREDESGQSQEPFFRSWPVMVALLWPLRPYLIDLDIIWLEASELGDALLALLAGHGVDPADQFLPALAQIPERGVVLRPYEAGMHET
jgi:hypothetical protein